MVRGRVCDDAAKALGSLATYQREVQAMNRYGSNYVATSAAQSLGKSGSRVLPVLRELLRDDRSEARLTATWKRRGPTARSNRSEATDECQNSQDRVYKPPGEHERTRWETCGVVRDRPHMCIRE
jgi:hypothetical protein